MKKVLLLTLSLLLLTAGMAAAAEDWLQIGGDYRFRYDVLEGKVHDYYQAPGGPGVPGYTVKNNSLMMNRFGLNLKADPMEDIVVKARLVMYKVAGHQTSTPALGYFFADRFAVTGTNDGTVSHVPQDSVVRVDYAFATVNNIFDAPMWFSIGRRPSTGGIPSNYRQNQEKIGTAGIPAILVDYAFDGMTLGYAPDIAKLPGAYAKLCYGRGYESGFRPGSSAGKDTDFLGLNAVAYDTEKLHVEVQYQKGSNIFDLPSDGIPGAFTAPTTNLGNLEWLGGVVTTKMGSLNLFASAATSKTDPNGNVSAAAGGGLLSNVSSTESHTGTAVYVGARLDMGSTKVGAEYNQGSKYWVGMVPDGDDIWTSKLGTRGSVYEVYLIQELKRKPISKKGKAFVRLGYQYYDFQYSGSNNWVGAPVKIDDMTTGNTALAQGFVPLTSAHDIYATFDVQF